MVRHAALSVLVAALALAAGCAPRSSEVDAEPRSPRLSAPQFLDCAPLENEGPFVEWPAQAGAFALGVPVSLAVMYAHSGDPLDAARTFGYLGYFAVGGPCWIVKKALWDLPWSFGRWATGSGGPPERAARNEENPPIPRSDGS